MIFDRIFPPSMWDRHQAEINQMLMECKEKGKQVHVLVEPEKRRRSTGRGSQNHHLNGHIQQIAMSTGQPFDDIKTYVKQMAIDMGYPMKERFGNPVTDLWGRPVGISESECTTGECALLIEATHRLAAELGIILMETEYAY